MNNIIEVSTVVVWNCVAKDGTLAMQSGIDWFSLPSSEGLAARLRNGISRAILNADYTPENLFTLVWTTFVTPNPVIL